MAPPGLGRQVALERGAGAVPVPGRQLHLAERHPSSADRRVDRGGPPAGRRRAGEVASLLARPDFGHGLPVGRRGRRLGHGERRRRASAAGRSTRAGGDSGACSRCLRADQAPPRRSVASRTEPPTSTGGRPGTSDRNRRRWPAARLPPARVGSAGGSGASGSGSTTGCRGRFGEPVDALRTVRHGLRAHRSRRNDPEHSDVEEAPQRGEGPSRIQSRSGDEVLHVPASVREAEERRSPRRGWRGVPRPGPPGPRRGSRRAAASPPGRQGRSLLRVRPRLGPALAPALDLPELPRGLLVARVRAERRPEELLGAIVVPVVAGHRAGDEEGLRSSSCPSWPPRGGAAPSPDRRASPTRASRRRARPGSRGERSPRTAASRKRRARAWSPARRAASAFWKSTRAAAAAAWVGARPPAEERARYSVRRSRSERTP